MIGIRTDVSNRTGLSISTYASGATGLYIINNVGGSGAIKSYGSHTFGQRYGDKWCAPGILYAGEKYAGGWNTYYRKVWGDGMQVTSCEMLSDARWRFTHSLYHAEYVVMVQGTADWNFYIVKDKTSTSFIVQQLTASGKGDDDPFSFCIIGRNVF